MDYVLYPQIMGLSTRKFSSTSIEKNRIGKLLSPDSLLKYKYPSKLTLQESHNRFTFKWFYSININRLWYYSIEKMSSSKKF